MIPIFAGMISAMIFGIVAFSLYGIQGIIQQSWIDEVFWILIFSGVMGSIIDVTLPCVRCRLATLINVYNLKQKLCSECRN